MAATLVSKVNVSARTTRPAPRNAPIKRNVAAAAVDQSRAPWPVALAAVAVVMGMAPAANATADLALGAQVFNGNCGEFSHVITLSALLGLPGDMQCRKVKLPESHVNPPAN